MHVSAIWYLRTSFLGHITKCLQNMMVTIFHLPDCFCGLHHDSIHKKIKKKHSTDQH